MDANTLLKEFFQNPIPFVAGFVAGALKIDLEQDPVKQWMEQRGVDFSHAAPSEKDAPKSGPQNITID